MDGGTATPACVFYGSSSTGPWWLGPVVSLAVVILGGLITWQVTVADRNQSRLIEAWATFMGMAAKNIVAIELYRSWDILTKHVQVETASYERRAAALESSTMDFESASTRLLMLEPDPSRRELVTTLKSMSEQEPAKTQADLTVQCVVYKEMLKRIASEIQKPVTSPFGTS